MTNKMKRFANVPIKLEKHTDFSKCPAFNNIYINIYIYIYIYYIYKCIFMVIRTLREHSIFFFFFKPYGILLLKDV